MKFSLLSEMIRRVLLVGGALALASGPAFADRVGAGSSTPTANSQRVSVYRNQSVVIRLSATSGSTSRLSFSVGNRPKQGTLSAILPVEGENAMADVVYTPNPESTAALDQFTFMAQLPGGERSSTSPVEIRILNPQARLRVEAPVEFKKVRVGEVGRAAFIVKNIGQARFRGRMELLSPWLLDRDVLEVEPGAVERVTVEFRPLVPGKVGTRLRLQGGDEPVDVAIYAEAVAPFHLQPGTVELSKIAGAGRRGTLEVENTTGEPMAISVNAPLDPENPSSRLQFPGKVELLAGEKKEVAFDLAPEDSGPFGEILTFSSKLYSVEVEVASKALPAELVLVEPVPVAGWDFGVVLWGEEAEPKTFSLANTGGAPLVATVDVVPPFAISGADKSLEIGGGERVEVTVLPTTKNVGEFTSELVFEHAGGRLAIPLGLSVVLPDSVSGTGAEVAEGNEPPDPPQVEQGGAESERPSTPQGTAISAVAPKALFNPDSLSPADSKINAIKGYYGIGQTPFDPNLPAVKDLKFLEGDHRSVKLSWIKAGNNVKTYEFERAQMYMDSSGMIVKHWIPWEGKVDVLENSSGAMKVQLEPFLPGTEYQMRLIAISESGGRALPSEPIVLTTGIPESGWKKFMRWAGIVFVVLVVFVGFRLFQFHRYRSEKGHVYAGGEQGGFRGMIHGLRVAIFR